MDTSSNNTSSVRKLAAILFADIVGYTSLMQKDEAHTLQIIKRYQTLLDAAAQQFNGKVLKNYGDGSLMTFSNSVDAVKAAKQIQEQAKLELVVPLRIGIHVGEFIVEKGDIYGNGVNLASRIESLGITGAVLFSKNIFQKIKNHPEFQVQSLGNFEFKNVEEPMEVFALANEGFIIPKKNEIKGKLKKSKKNSNKWILPVAAISLLLISCFLYLSSFSENKLTDEILNARIAVIPFENKTNDTLLKVLGNLIADCITRNLTNLDNTKISQYENVQQNQKLLKSSPKQFADATGADFLIQGRYYKEGNELIFESRISDPISNEIIFSLNEIRGNEDKPSEVISELAQRITGYFSYKNSKFAGFSYAPKHEAFVKYNEGAKVFGKDYDLAIQYYDEAIKFDSNFITPYLQIAVANLIQGKDAIADSLLQLTEKRFPNPPKHEGYYMKVVKHLIHGNMEREFEYVKNMFELDPKSFAYNYQMGQTSVGYNRPQTTVDAFSLLNPESIQWEGRLKYWWHGVYGEALMRLERYEEALQLFVGFSKEESLHRFRYLKSPIFVFQNQQDSLNALIEDMENYGFSEDQILGRLYKIAYDYGSIGDKTNQLLWGKRMLKRIQNRPESVELPLTQLGNAYFITEDYENMLNTYKRIEQKEGETWEYLIHVGFAYVKMGNEAKANAFIEKYKNLEDKYSRGRYKYAQAVLYAGMNKKEEAMRYLKLAFKEGWEFGNFYYNYSYELSSLRGYPPFEEFIKPKE